MMALPKPTYPPVVPQSFLSSRDDRLMSLGLELYARYHPGAMQQQMYQALLEEETWQGAQEAEKVQRLVQERQRLLDLRTQVQAARATGGGLSVRGSGGGRTKGGASRGWASTSKSMVDLYLGEGKLTQAAKDDVHRDYSVPKGGDYVVSQIINRLDAISQKQGLTNETLDQVIRSVVDETLRAPNSPMWEWKANTPQVKALASELWMKLAEHPQFNQMESFTIGPGGRRAEGGVAAAIDKHFDTGGWLSTIRAANAIPGYELQAEMNAVLAGKTPSGFKYDLDGDGTISEEERKAAAARDPDRLFEDRIAQLDAQIAAREQRSSPMARAARRTLGDPVEDELPYIPPEAIAAATAAGGPIAAEALPYAVRRFEQGRGTITPKTGPESFAEGVIKISGRDFQGFLRAVNDKYGNDVGKAREAIAYYGARFTEIDMQTQTIDPGARKGSVAEAASGLEATAARTAPEPEASAVEVPGPWVVPESGLEVLIEKFGVDDAIGAAINLRNRYAVWDKSSQAGFDPVGQEAFNPGMESFLRGNWDLVLDDLLVLQPEGSWGEGSDVELAEMLYRKSGQPAAPTPDEPGLWDRAKDWGFPNMGPYTPRAVTTALTPILKHRPDWWRPGGKPIGAAADAASRLGDQAQTQAARARDLAVLEADAAGLLPPVMDPFVEGARGRAPEPYAYGMTWKPGLYGHDTWAPGGFIEAPLRYATGAIAEPLRGMTERWQGPDPFLMQQAQEWAARYPELSGSKLMADPRALQSVYGPMYGPRTLFLDDEGR